MRILAGFGGGAAVFPDGHATLTNSVIAFGVDGEAIWLAPTTSTAIPVCCDLYGNERGDWVGAISPQHGSSGNISADPLFCREQNPGAPLSLDSASPCIPFSAPNPECDGIGAWGVGCGATSRQRAAIG